MNVYHKFCPNVWLAKCEESHEKGDVIRVTTQRGNENECVVFNLIGQKAGFFYYSVVRADGFNAQEYALKRAERLRGFAKTAEEKSEKYFNASQEGKEFLSLGEPIKVGHHSENRHRKLIEKNWERMGKSVELSEKADEYESRAQYWESRAKDINLSMPESLEYYEHKIEETKRLHEGLKNGTIKREHSYSLTYAQKAVKEAQKNFDLAKKLWG